jgi:L-threonylcarbamoyladenylate synthase
LPAPGDARRHRSPGQKYRHYAPRARVIVVEPGAALPAGTDAFIGLVLPAGAPRRRRICADAPAYARDLFQYFRACDAAGARRIACQAVPERGIGLALMDRLRRAADSTAAEPRVARRKSKPVRPNSTAGSR